MDNKKNKENFLKRKTQRNDSNQDSKPKNKKTADETLSKNKNFDKISLIEIVYKKARNIYDEKTSEFDLDQVDPKNKDKRWTAEILKTGTLEDKISSLVLYIKKNPRKCLKYVDQLLKMAKKKNRRQTEACVFALKDIFLDDILTNKKLNSFYNTLNNLKVEEGVEISSLSDERIYEIYTDDFIHKKYSELIEIIEDIIINDPLKAMKKKYLNILLDMIMKKPEKEEKILEVLINKLGDPDAEITSHTIKLLKDLQMSHPKMSLIIFKHIQNFVSKIPDENQNARFYSLVYLTGMNMINDENFIEYSLQYFFDLFNFYSNLSEEAFKIKNKKRRRLNTEEINPNKFLSLIVKRINIICKFASEKNISIKKLLDEKINTLFKLSHSESIKLRIEVLKLIFMICQGVVSGSSSKNKDGESSYLDRYYRSLYEILLIKEVIFSKHLREILKLIMMSLSFDTNICRVAAFLKRLLQMSLHAEPPFITCSLIITSQILRNKHKLWKMVEKNNFSASSMSNISDRHEKSDKNDKTEEKENPNGYDFMKRDPIYTNADLFPISELYILCSHYHPTVQKFSTFILENFNKDIIAYEGDPLLDFSLLNFLEKFMLKNPKIKKDKLKHKVKSDKDEEDLLKFIGDDETENKNENDEKADKKGAFDLDFIRKFNEIEKTKSVKYEKNLEKKKKKKAAGENADADIEEFADKLMEEEYKKFDKDIDEDVDFDDEDQNEDNGDVDQEEELEGENFEDLDDE